MPSNTTKQCTTPNCHNKHLARGHCSTHYYAWQRAHRMNHEYQCAMCKATYKTHRTARGQHPTCSAPCHQKLISWRAAGHIPSASRELDLCHTFPALQQAEHAYRERRKNIAQSMNRDANLTAQRHRRSPLRAAYEDGNAQAYMDALRDKVKIGESQCWEWTGGTNGGYPKAKWARQGIHRATLEMKHGKPLGSQAAHHMCANTICVNPDHLQPVTHRENMAEMLARNSLINRISELEKALAELNPDHALLNLIAIR